MIAWSIIWRFLAGNIWRTAALFLIVGTLALSTDIWLLRHKVERVQASAAVALDANQAQQSVIKRLQTELDAANRQVSVWVDSTNRAEAARAAEQAAANRRAVMLQKRLDRALRDNADFAATPVPKAVQEALK